MITPSITTHALTRMYGSQTALDAVTLSVEPGYLRQSGAQAPSVNSGSPATTVVLAAKDGIVLKRR